MKELRWFVFVLAAGAAGCEGSSVGQPAPGTRRVEIRVAGAEFSPAEVAAGAGEKLELVFTRRGPSCADRVEFPSLGIERDLPDGEPVKVALTAPASGSVEFHCPMKMAKGRVRVR